MIQGVSFQFDNNQQKVLMSIEPKELEDEIDAQSLFEKLLETPFNEVYLSQRLIKEACDRANHLYKTGDDTEVNEEVGDRRDAEVIFKLSDDKMEATMEMTSPFGGRCPGVNSILKLAKDNDVTRGVSIKRIKKAIKKIRKSGPGEVVETLIAKGLPPRDGRSSHMKPLVPNALERVLKPQINEKGKADLRNLGEMICVKPGAELVKRIAPTKGRAGYTVSGKKLDANEGQWIPIKMGDGTALSEQDENLIVAVRSGMPKFEDLCMTVDDTFICNGVNVGTGHVNYDGAVLVNGDVTEKMRIIATGDVTVNGFVESAYIEAGGDIIITEGAIGKESEEENAENTCILKSDGSIHVQHGQGIRFECQKTVSIGKQLAYSKIKSTNVIVGTEDKPSGNLYACEVEVTDGIAAGTIGAISGSSLMVDFSPGYNEIIERLETLNEMLKRVQEENMRHKDKLSTFDEKPLPQQLKMRLAAIKSLFDNERELMVWIEEKVQKVRQAKDQYTSNARIIATKTMHSGVSVKLNNRSMRTDREYPPGALVYQEHQWQYEATTS